MNGFIIETKFPDERARSGQRGVRWIGIAKSAKDITALLPGHSPSVVDRGAGILARARVLGVKDGEFREFLG